MQQTAEQKLKPVTAEDLLRMADVGLRRELVRGELKTMAPAPSSGSEFGTSSWFQPTRY